MKLESNNANLTVKLSDSEKNNDSLREHISNLSATTQKQDDQMRQLENELDEKNDEVHFLTHDFLPN